jgi:hypothetical protein
MKLVSLVRPMALLFASTMVPACVAADIPLRMEVTVHTDVHHEFTGFAKSYGVTITNLTDSTATIERGILVEKKTSSGWINGGGIEALASCDDFDESYNWKAPISLAPHRTLAVFPWDGFMCGGQCIASCLQNGKQGPGTYRFVVVVVPGGERIASPPFTIPGS